ncbi:hypothetical protein Cni_G19034 [Canna indica]|uniref:BZIP domain-containing protein n=1 Tax=Canna indica TaxID=4628 RepID=A0AAQ3KLF9_9LILI|nr:hypothetical protein Cni_G19034 [Canna indica]
MSSFPIRRASSPEGDSNPAIDDRKRKRMISNRESARRSRQRKQQHLDELIQQESQLKDQNNQFTAQINLVTQRYLQVESENAILRAQMSELTARLNSMNSVLQIVEEVSGMVMDIPDPLLEPWQLPCTAQPIMANADIFQL